MEKQKHILVAPLNWGLGHATRCIPIIRGLLALGHRVSIASDGRALILLQKEFPDLPSIVLPAYNVRYPYPSMELNIALQFPKLLLALYKERRFLRKILKEQHFDAIISDNRFGLSHPTIPSVFISHQLNIKINQKVLQGFVNKLNHYYLSKFDECWVPDVEGENNLAGSLAHPSPVDNTFYMGTLSRFTWNRRPFRRKILAMLSGPEPQRSYLEQVLIEQIKALGCTALIVGGKTDEQQCFAINSNVDYVSYMNSEELNEALLESEIVICRSGYSSLMDLAKVNCKKAILIPTPGQTEQVYLATNLSKNNIFYCQNQKNLHLADAIRALKDYKGIQAFENNQSLDLFLTRFAQTHLTP